MHALMLVEFEFNITSAEKNQNLKCTCLEEEEKITKYQTKGSQSSFYFILSKSKLHYPLHLCQNIHSPSS